VAAATLKVVYSPAAPQVGQNIVFNAEQSAAAPGHTLTDFNWNFGDGGTAGGSIVTHAFASAGSYNVVLSALDDTGQRATTSVSVVVSASGGGGGGATSASFVASPSAPVVGQVVFFNASGSTASTGHTLTKYAWDFGDGTLFTATSASTNHTFTTAGTFTVTLLVTDDAGQTAKTTNAVTVAPAGAVAPTANFTISPAAPGVNESVFFNAGTSLPGVGHTIVSYQWTFGDGGTASGVTASHTYSTAGTYAAQLKVTDEAGQSSTSAATSITVGSPPAPTAAFTFSPAVPLVGQQVVFDASTSTTAQGQTIVDVAWNFGDGTAVIHCGTLFGNDPSCVNVGVTNRISVHTYATPNTFVVNLVVTDTAGRTGAKATSVTIK
jgi:PKD repeat protein